MPDHLIDAVWAHLQWQQNHPEHSELPCQVDSVDQLSNLIYPAFQASLRTEEGRPVRLRIAFNPQPKRLTVPLRLPRAYSSQEMIKLAPTIGLGHRWLIATPSPSQDNGIAIEGIYDPDILPPHRGNQIWGNTTISFQDYLLPSLKVVVLGPAWLRVSTFLNAFELHNANLLSPQSIGKNEHVRSWMASVPELLSINERMAARSSSILARRFLIATLAHVIDERHGGCLLVLPQNADQASLPLRTKYQSESYHIQAMIRQRAAVIPKPWGTHPKPGESMPSQHGSTVSDALLLDRDLAHMVDCLAGLAAVDGAVLLTRDLRLLGFGAEIVLPSALDSEWARCGVDSLKCDESEFGMRHRSAARFCQSVPGAMAFVISQDGGIRFFCNDDGRMRQWDDLTAEEL